MRSDTRLGGDQSEDDMTFGTATLILALIYVTVHSQGFRMFLLIIGSLAIGGILFLVDFGADKPQTIFYNHSAHPAYLMRAGDVCPDDRHVWNHWCVK
jgi:hypothetical protein